MTPFVILYIYLIVAFFASKQIKNPQKRSKRFCVFSFLGLLFLLGFHSPTIGTDVDGFYVPYFERCLSDPISFSFVGGIEPLFHDFTYLIKSLTDDVQVYLFIVAIIILFPIIFLFYKHSNNIFLSLIFYVSFTLFHFAFSGLRQAMAISIVCLGFYYLLKNNWKLFVLLVLLASTFHTSAIFAIIALPLMKIDLSDYVWLIIFIVFAFIIAAMPSVILVIVDLIFSEGKYQSALDEKNGSITLAFLYLLFALFQIFLAKKNHQKSMVQFTLLLFVVQLTGLRSNFAARIGYYFLPLMFIFIPNVIESTKGKGLKNLLVTAFTAFLVFFFVYSNGGGYLEVIPFKFCWE